MSANGLASDLIRAARITDGPALGTLSRQVHASADSHRRSLGVPAPPASQPRIEMSTLIPSWLPLRAPSLHLVAEGDGTLLGSCRAIEEPRRADWVVIELDALPGAQSQEVRWQLLNRHSHLPQPEARPDCGISDDKCHHFYCTQVIHLCLNISY